MNSAEPTTPPDPLSVGLLAVLQVAEAHLVRELELAPQEVPGRLARLPGQIRDQALTMHTRAFAGGSFTRLIVATITREVDLRLSSLTIIGTPTAASGLPILGVDLIALGGALSLAAVDFAPTDDRRWENDAAPLLERLHAAVTGKVVARRWPSFAREVFSPKALIVGAKPGTERHVLQATAALLRDFAAVAGSPRALPADQATAGARRLAAWEAAERRNRREHDALSRIFGASAGERFLTYLFGQKEHDDGD